jgi:predicted molibdopterin-dependent oxidoreductase YjgC
MHTGSYTQESKVLSSLSPKDILEINPADAEKLRLKKGDMVNVISRRGEIQLPVTILDRVAEGTVFTTFHSVDLAVNVLTNDALDPLPKVPEIKICAVRIEKV